ncbi:hypothetical protein J5Y04_31670 [Kitasatospora sp. RG8]|uniref:DUF6191 domain-containing protein n=1 Tax=Kitasatospora sp. RG8 TaxID=2820815 RepID=UPI001ADF225C|nr:DUF6191 domain-containing protein [Kitasatospora sp. RG8]MBP0454067.1 hypothetical protein [Kitasatospora sp. RG8]
MSMVGPAVGAVAAVPALLLVDRLLLWMERRGWIYWRRRRAGVGAASSLSMMDELNAFLSPGRQQMREEKERRLVLRDDAGSADPLEHRIDLESGRVTVRPGGPEQPGR